MPTRPAFLAGFGFGAFLDGIVFHQLLQWHHFVSEKRSPDDLAGLEHNTLWDGIFHIASWVVLFAAVTWLWSRRTETKEMGVKWLSGMMLLGWGVFNVVDEVVFHLLLQAHHIRQVEDWVPYDATYTVFGVVIAIIGWRIAKTSAPQTQLR